MRKNYSEKQKKEILSQNFVASEPNQIWVSDVTYFSFKNVKPLPYRVYKK